MALGGYLEEIGHEVVIIDGEPDLLDESETLDLVLKTQPDIVGITATTPEYPFAYSIIKAIKLHDPKIITVLGGAHITNLPEHTMEDISPYLDWGVIYEGEKPMAAIANGHPEEFIWKMGKNPRLLMDEDRLSGMELSSFEPSRTILDMSKYRFVDTTMGLVQNDALEAARGCPFACTFCTSRKTLLAARSLDSVLSEIINSAEKYKTKLFMFFDDTFTIDKRKAIKMFQEIISLKKQGRLPSDVHFYGFTRANTMHDFELLKIMKEAGCDKITFGIETGNSDILKSTQKGTKLDDYRLAYSMLEEVGVTKRGSFIIGHPFETAETIQDSINFAIELDLDEVGVNIMTPYPGQVTFRDAYEGKGIWLSGPHHYAEFKNASNGNGNGTRESWEDYQSIDWHQYWKEHLRWGRAVVETETLSSEALSYWHGRFLQEVYGSENMAKRRQKQIGAGNNDEYWHRPWRVNAKRRIERIEAEKKSGMPHFELPMHLRYTYDPIVLKDYQKNELVLAPVQRQRAMASTIQLLP